MHDIFHKKKHLKEKEKEVNIRKMGYSHQARWTCNIHPSLLGEGCQGHCCVVSLAAGRSQKWSSSMPSACKHHPTRSPGMSPCPSETWHGFVFPHSSLLWGLMYWALKLPEKSLTHLFLPITTRLEKSLSIWQLELIHQVTIWTCDFCVLWLLVRPSGRAKTLELDTQDHN